MDCVCNDYVCNVSCCFLNLDFLVFYRRKIFKKSSHVIMSIILSRLLQYESSDCLIIIDEKFDINDYVSHLPINDKVKTTLEPSSSKTPPTIQAMPATI